MIPGISTSFKRPKEKIDKLKGISFVEIWYKDLINKTPKELHAFKENLTKAGIQVWSIHTPCGEGQELSEIDESLRFRAVAVQKSLLTIAEFLGASIMVLHPGGKVAPENRPAHEEKLLLSLQELIKVAKGSSIRFGLENLPPGNMGDDPAQLLSYVEEIASPKLGITFDTGHAHLNGDVLKTFDQLKKHVIHFHLSDNDGKEDQHLPPGFGNIDWVSWFSHNAVKEWKHPMVLECEPYVSQASYLDMAKHVFGGLKAST